MPLDSSDPNQRMEALEKLRQTGKVEILPQLVAALQDDDVGVRQVAARALTGIEVNDTDVMAALVAALHDEDVWVCVYASTALGKAGPPAVPLLLNALQDEKATTRYFAVKALSIIRDADTVPALINLLDDGRPDVRWIAAEALGLIGDIRAIAALIVCLNDEERTRWFGDESVAQATAKALQRIGSAEATEALARWQRSRRD